MSDCNKNEMTGELEAPRRNNYFYGKMLDEKSLTMEQRYFNQKRWMLNRLGLGSGVLCGLNVTVQDQRICISAGVAIDGLGREIVVPSAILRDPRQITDDAGRPTTLLTGDGEVYLTLCYCECSTDDVPVLVTDCDSTNQTAPSTITEGYCLIVKPCTEREPAALPPVTDLELCKALNDSEADAEKKRKMICEVLSKRPCPVPGDCIVLAKVVLSGATVTVEKCAVRPMVYSNPELFEMLMCLSGQGGSGTTGTRGPVGIDDVTVTKLLDCNADPTATIDDKSVEGKRILVLGVPKGCDGIDGIDGIDGKDGLGLYPDLPKILDIGWQHNELSAYRDFLLPFVDGETLASSKVLIDRIKHGKNIPPFTIYFNKELDGIDQQTFSLRIKVPVVVPASGSAGPVEPLGVYLELEVYGDILFVDKPISGILTPHTHEPFVYAASFIPRAEFFQRILPFVLVVGWVGNQQHQLAHPTFHIRLKGDFVCAHEFSENAVLDADNIGGNVGLDVVRFPPPHPKNPSGNLTQGGDFESWLPITLRNTSRDSPSAGTPFISDVPISSMLTHGFNLAAFPVSVNLASMAQLLAAGLTEAQAKTIIQERGRSWFRDSQDLVKRVKLSSDTLEKVQSKIIVL